MARFTWANAYIKKNRDTRRRLVGEVRTGTFQTYDLEYEYDDGGNRTAKIDNQNDMLTEYHYDTESPGDYMSNYNRLQYYEVFDTSGQSQTLVSTTWYYYSDDDGTTWGNPKRIVTEQVADPGVFHSVRFGYAADNRTVSYVVGETWEWAAPATCEATDSYEILWAREFRYDSGRARYLSRELNAAQLELGNIVAASELWTDYDGSTSYGDYSVAAGSPPSVTNLASYEPGMGQVETWTDEGDDNTIYQLTDHLGTVRGYTDWDGVLGDPAVYTAFGEKVYGQNHRYGYVGAHGYQEHAEFPFLHVGARYYDPATGRFLQRDPIGVFGGLNVFIYVMNIPTAQVAASGNGPLDLLYTGSWSPPPGAYDDAVDAAARWLLGNSPVRGGYAGVGVGGNRGPGAGAAGSWTIDSGPTISCGGYWSRSARTRIGDGTFASNTRGIGGEISYGEGGWGGSIIGGVGQNQKGRGGTLGGSSGGEVYVGIQFWLFNFGLVIDPSKLPNLCD